MKTVFNKTRKQISALLGLLTVICLCVSAMTGLFVVSADNEEENTAAFSKVAWYEFDDETDLGKDSSGNNNNLIVKGVGKDSINGGIALKNNGLLYAPALGDVTEDFVCTDFSDNVTGSFSVSMRLYLRSVPGGGGNSIVDCGSYGSHFKVYYGYNNLSIAFGNGTNKDFAIGLTNDFAWYRANFIYDEATLTGRMIVTKEDDDTFTKFDETVKLSSAAKFGGHEKYVFTVGAQSILGLADDQHASFDEDTSIYPNISDLRVYQGVIDDAEMAAIAKYDVDKLNATEKPTFEVKPISAWDFADATNLGKDLYGNNDLLLKNDSFTVEDGALSLTNGNFMYAQELSEGKDVSDYLSTLTLTFRMKAAKKTDGAMHFIATTGSWGGAFSVLQIDDTLQVFYGGGTQIVCNNVFGDTAEWFTFICTADSINKSLSVYMAKDGDTEATLIGSTAGYDVIISTNYCFSIGAWSVFGERADFINDGLVLADVRLYDFSFTQTQATQLVTESETVKVVSYNSNIEKVEDLRYDDEVMATASEKDILGIDLPETVKVTNAANNTLTANIVWTKVVKNDYSATVIGFLTGKGINNSANYKATVEVKYAPDESEYQDIKPLVWYEFNDKDNLGKDSMGNFDLKVGGKQKIDYNEEGKYITFKRENQSYLYAPAVTGDKNFSRFITGSYTVSITVNADNSITDGSYYMINTNAYGEGFLIYGCYGQYTVIYSAGGAAAHKLVVNTGVLTDSWVTLTVTVDKTTGLIAFYKNAELLISKTVDNFESFAYDQSRYTFAIGAQATVTDNDGTQYYDGSISDVKVYDYALSARNVGDLIANAGKTDALKSYSNYCTVTDIEVDLEDVDTVLSKNNTLEDIYAGLPISVKVTDSKGGVQECEVEWLGRKNDKIVGYVKGCEAANVQGLKAEVALSYKIEMDEFKNGELKDVKLDGEAFDAQGIHQVGVEKTLTFTAQANEYYEVNYITVNDVKLVVGENGVYTVKVSDYALIKTAFSAKKYTITYVLNNGEANETAEYSYGEAKTLDDYFTKAGYVFAGWYTTEDLSGEQFTAIDSNNPTDLVLYAKWTKEGEHPGTSEPTQSGTENKEGCRSSVADLSVVLMLSMASAISVIIKKKRS